MSVLDVGCNAVCQRFFPPHNWLDYMRETFFRWGGFGLGFPIAVGLAVVVAILLYLSLIHI